MNQKIWRNKSNQVPTNPEALFNIVSISKLYIAAVTVKLVHNSSLSFDDMLLDHLPDLKDSPARYHKAMDTVIVQFVNTPGENTLMVSNVVYNRIVRILSGSLQ